jgi:tRNA A-37 threonylcarbamoyl transferase component Bud32
LRRADQLQLAAAAGLWRLLEEGRHQLDALHAGGLAHGDAELQNLIVCPAPLEVLLIDFETAVRRDAVDETAWQARCLADRVPMLKEAIFLQAVLGRQPGTLADEAWEAAPRLFRDAGRLRRAIEQLATLNP